MPALDRPTPPQAEPSWQDTIRQYGPAVLPILVGAMLGKPSMRLAAARFAPSWAKEVEASRIPFAFREVPKLEGRGMVEPTRLTDAEIRQFAQHPASSRFKAGDPAFAVQVRNFPESEIAQRRPYGAPGRVPAAPIHPLIHETEHAYRVAQSARDAAPLTLGAHTQHTGQEHLLQTPEFPAMLTDLLAKWPDLHGMYHAYRMDGPASVALGELLTEARTRMILGEKVPPSMRLTPQQMMIFRTRPEIEADERLGRQTMHELDLFTSRRHAIPSRNPKGAGSNRLLNVDPFMEERLDAARRGRPIPRPDFTQFDEPPL